MDISNWRTPAGNKTEAKGKWGRKNYQKRAQNGKLGIHRGRETWVGGGETEKPRSAAMERASDMPPIRLRGFFPTQVVSVLLAIDDISHSPTTSDLVAQPNQCLVYWTTSIFRFPLLFYSILLNLKKTDNIFNFWYAEVEDWLFLFLSIVIKLSRTLTWSESPLAIGQIVWLNKKKI